MQMISADTLARGLWEARGEAPLVVSDPLHARHLLGLDHIPPSAAARSQHKLGVMPVSLFRRAVPQLAPGKLREFERLLTGGDLLFADVYHNLVVDQGLNDLLSGTLVTASADTSWHVGLTDLAPVGEVPADTMLSHGGWVEILNFTGSPTRPAWTAGAVAGKSVSNTAAPASFTINATVTIGGSFLTSNPTGTAGRLYSVGAFSGGDKGLNNLDTLSVTATFTTAAA